MSGLIQQIRAARSFAIKAVDVIYDTSMDVLLGYLLALAFLVAMGWAVSSGLISPPVMHPA